MSTFHGVRIPYSCETARLKSAQARLLVADAARMECALLLSEGATSMQVISHANPPTDREKAAAERPSNDAQRPKTEADIAFVLELGRALQKYGVPCRQIEDVIARAAEKLGLEVEVFSTVTALIVTFGTAEHMRTTFTRLEAAEVHLGGLAELDCIVTSFLDGSTGPNETRLALARLES